MYTVKDLIEYLQTLDQDTPLASTNMCPEYCNGSFFELDPVCLHKIKLIDDPYCEEALREDKEERIDHYLLY